MKVLDFGLVKLSESGSGSGNRGSGGANAALSISPTITSPVMMTGVGVLLGTAPYMAPEQAKGKAADKRSDIWAFGCVLFEMLTGERAFNGDDLTETIASVVRADPDWQRVPSYVRAMLRACLEKDPRRRLHDIGDVWRLLADDRPEAQPVAARRP